MRLSRDLRRIGVVLAAAVLTPALLTPALPAGASAAATQSPAVAHPAAVAPATGAAAGAWGTAVEVPGTKALNTGGGAALESMSCTSAGGCSAGGVYATRPFCGYQVCRSQGFVISRVRGKWGTARPVPGLAALNRGHRAQVVVVSCASPGNCGAGGSYTGPAGRSQAFVVSQVRGRWGKAREVPGTAALNQEGAAVTALSCASAGNCSAGGSYTDTAGHPQAFVVSEIRGRWGRARQLPGTAALNGGDGVSLGSLSCGSPGNCSAGGFYADASGNRQAFLVSQVRGAWGAAREVPGTAVLNVGGWAQVSSLSCAAAGQCTAVGVYDPSTFDQQCCNQAFVISQVRGTWGTAQQVPGIAQLGGKGEDAQLDTVSCASAGNCAAGGKYDTDGFDEECCGQAFVVSQVHGTWGSALRVPGTRRLNSGDQAEVSSVSCASAGNCAAGGGYGVGTFGNKVYDDEVFVVSEVNGTWRQALKVPGSGRFNKGHGDALSSVSCGAPGQCSAGGGYWGSKSYAASEHAAEAFLVSQR
jgi:hypothetical protein